MDATFSHDGRRIVTASTDGTARVWNAFTGELLAMLSGHTRVVSHARFSLDGQRIVTSSLDTTARVFRLTTLTEIVKLLQL